MTIAATPLVIGTDGAALRRTVEQALRACGVDLARHPDGAGTLDVSSPVTGDVVATVPLAAAGDVESAIAAADETYRAWRRVPAPGRGRLVRRLGDLLQEHRSVLADLVGVEVGKIRSEALGEVQEMIDVCDFAVGLSRQLGGLTMPSERPGHRLMETWHPVGVVGVISAFNFPVAVWAWNTALALVCGNTVVWKPSERTPLTALACSALLDRAARELDLPAGLNTVVVTDAAGAARELDLPAGLNTVVVTDAAGAAPLVDSPRVPVVSATGSERLGEAIAPRIAARFGRAILELGGNNAAVVTPSADLDLAVRGIVFAAAGTAGQRCTTLRRVIVHESVADELLERLRVAYRSLAIGDPFDEGTLVGPLFTASSFEQMQSALAEARADGGVVVVGGERVPTNHPGAYYVEPAVVRMPAQTAVVRRETFAPLLHVLTYTDFEEAISLNNGVPQGLSSAVFTRDQREAELFLSSEGSDCGIANVNLGTSGAEIGGAFGGEKTTGGGRESGSDAWRSYMRRATNTVNYSRDLPLAQGVSFG
ncbi:aldehyde dehydrogenase family protein [Kineococcus sp. SYSU DK003]|uniref:aldehyde dehydrogenase family protein n=1 Tax=Kineococcus sp. SYSU DK003 TaxID=3383124 RepID=UPI003D7D5D4F